MTLPAPPAAPTSPSRAFDALLPARRYRARDFEFLEDLVYRWTAVAVFGAAYLAIAGFLWVAAAGSLGITAEVTLFSGVVLFVVVTPIVFTFVSGESAFATILAGFSSGGAFLSIVTHVNDSALGTFLYFAVAGSVCVGTGVGLALKNRAALLGP